MMMMPAIGYEAVMGFNWHELKSWHETALTTWKAMRGIP
jgi:hypothetical protein